MKEYICEEEIHNHTIGELQELSENLQKAKNDYLYLLADFENYKKRIQKHRENDRIYQDEHLLTALLPAFTNLYYGAIADKNCLKIYNSFKQELEKVGIKMYYVHPGEIFSEESMEAANTNSTFHPDDEGKVHMCLSPGFILKDKIIQYPKVVVNKKF